MYYVWVIHNFPRLAIKLKSEEVVAVSDHTLKSYTYKSLTVTAKLLIMQLKEAEKRGVVRESASFSYKQLSTSS